MATSLSSRSRRPDYGHSSGHLNNSVNFAPSGVAPYPSPVSLRTAAHSSSLNSSHQAPGPAPGTKGRNNLGGSSRRLPPPPPPSQDFRQYAQHFPALNYQFPAPSDDSPGIVDQEPVVAGPGQDKVLVDSPSPTRPANEMNWQQLAPRYIYQHPTGFYGQQPQLIQQQTDGPIIHSVPADYYIPHYYVCPEPGPHNESSRDYNEYMQQPQQMSSYNNFCHTPPMTIQHQQPPDIGRHPQPKMDFTPNRRNQHHPNVERSYVSNHHPEQQRQPNDLQDESNNNSNHQDNVNRNSSSTIHTIKVRAVVSGWKAGTIIGRQGQVISNLRAESQCKITISDDPSTGSRVLTIIGQPGKVSDVLRRVCFMIGNSASAYYLSKENSVNHTNGSKSKPTDSIDSISDTNPESLPPISFTLAVPSALCGCLIGKAGIQIKNFKQTFGVSFSVSSHSILESSDRPVHISGPPSNVANCLAEVCGLFSEPLSSSGASRAKQHDGVEPYCYQENGRPLYGVFRSNWRRNLSDADAADQVHHHGESEGEGEMVGIGGENRRLSLQQYDSKQNIKKQRRRQSRRHVTGPVSQDDHSSGGISSCNGNHGEILGNAIEECSFTLNTGETEVHLLVPNDIVGCIIGKGGQTISEIRSTSGAMISITESAFPPPMPLNAISSSYPTSNIRRDHHPANDKRGLRSRDRVICIRGRSKNIRTARYLMGSSILSVQKTNGSSGGVTSSQYRTTGCNT